MVKSCDGYTVIQLRDKARQQKRKKYSRLRKKELCKLLKIPLATGLRKAARHRYPDPQLKQAQHKRKDKSAFCKDYKVPELRKLSKSEGKQGYSKLRKHELCKLLNIRLERILRGESRLPATLGKSCRSDQVRNPITNRCVQKDGHLYKQLVKKGVIFRDGVSIGIHKHGIEIDFEKKPVDMRRDLTDIIQQELDCGNLQIYRREKLLGKSWARVYVYCVVRVNKKRYCELAIKIEKCDTDKTSSFPDLSKAVMMQNKVADVGLAPRVYSIKKCRNNICITVMDRMKGADFHNLVRSGRATARDIEDAIATIHKMHSVGARHGDLNLHNLMRVRGKMMIFDFAYTSKRPSRTPADDWAILLFHASYHGFERSKKYKRLYEEAMENVCKSGQREYKKVCKDYNDLGGKPTDHTIQNIYHRHRNNALQKCFGINT